MKNLIVQALWLSLLAGACHCTSDSSSSSKTSSDSANNRVKRQVSDNTGIVNIPDTIAGATPPPTAGPLTPGPTLPPTTARPGFFGIGGFNFPSIFNFGGNTAPGFSNNPFGNFGGGLGGASGNAGGAAGGAGGFPNFPSFPTPRPPTNNGGFGPGGFPPINGNGFPPISGGTGGFPDGGSSNNNNNNNGGGNTNPGGGIANPGGNTGAGNIGGGNAGAGGFPDFTNFGGAGGNNNPAFPGFPSFNNQPGGNPFNNFPTFSTRAPPTFPSVNLPTTPSSPSFSTNICTPPVFTPLGDRVSNTTQPQDVLTTINQELSFNPQLAAFLSFASQINGAPVNNNNNEDSDLSCPSSKQRATVFQRYGSNCWILQDQQQPYYYATCTCNQCLSPTGFQQPPGSACEPYLQPTAVFAYCENGLNSQNKITQERVAIPVTCRCRHAAPSATLAPPAGAGGGNSGIGGQPVPVATTPSSPISGGIPGDTVVVGRA